MTVTLNLSPKLEQDLIGDGTESCPALLQMEEGVPVLCAGRPMALQRINDTLERVRLERDMNNLGNL